jgi:hypothetical protein
LAAEGHVRRIALSTGLVALVVAIAVLAYPQI